MKCKDKGCDYTACFQRIVAWTQGHPIRRKCTEMLRMPATNVWALLALVSVSVAGMIILEYWIGKMNMPTRIAPQKRPANSTDRNTTVRIFSLTTTASTAAALESTRTTASPPQGEKVEKSAFKLFGYADIQLMKPLPELRPLLNFTMLPWKVKAERSIFAKDTERSENWAMIVVVKSAADHFEMRRTVRETWGSVRFLNGVRLERVFIVGTVQKQETQNDLLNENEIHGDLLQTDVEDNYENVGFKTLAGMQWVAENFPQHWIYSSADDDMAPYLLRLYQALEKLMMTSSRNFYTATGEKHPGQNPSISPSPIFSPEVITQLPIYCGFMFGTDEHPRRDKSKWYVDIATYPLGYYPPYCHGGWYSMPVNLASRIYEVSRRHRFYWMDDVWITGFLRLSYFNGHFGSTSSHFGVSKSSHSIGIRGEKVAEHHGSNVENMMKDWQKLKNTIIGGPNRYTFESNILSNVAAITATTIFYNTSSEAFGTPVDIRNRNSQSVDGTAA